MGVCVRMEQFLLTSNNGGKKWSGKQRGAICR